MLQIREYFPSKTVRNTSSKYLESALFYPFIETSSTPKLFHQKHFIINFSVQEK